MSILYIGYTLRYIRGGGIGGLFAAFTIGEALPDVQIDVYEAAHAFGEIGAGIGAGESRCLRDTFLGQCTDEFVEGCNAVRVLEELGLAKDVAAKSDTTSSNEDGNGHYAFMGSFKYVDSRWWCPDP